MICQHPTSRYEQFDPRSGGGVTGVETIQNAALKRPRNKKEQRHENQCQRDDPSSPQYEQPAEKAGHGAQPGIASKGQKESSAQQHEHPGPEPPGRPGQVLFPGIWWVPICAGERRQDEPRQGNNPHHELAGEGHPVTHETADSVQETNIKKPVELNDPQQCTEGDQE